MLNAGWTLQKTCIGCGHSELIDTTRLAPNPTYLENLLRLGMITCSQCESRYIVLAGDAAGSGTKHLLVANSPYPPGTLYSNKNMILERSADSIFIPYGDDGKPLSQRSPYIDLKPDPSALANLPEICSATKASCEYGGTAAFKRLVHDLNKGSTLTSLGCSWESAWYEEQYLTYGYVDVAITPLAENSHDKAKQLGQQIVDALARQARPSTKGILTLKMGIFELRPIFVLDVELIAASRDERNSFLLWEDLLEDLRIHLLRSLPADL